MSFVNYLDKSELSSNVRFFRCFSDALLDNQGTDYTQCGRCVVLSLLSVVQARYPFVTTLYDFILCRF